MSFFEWAVKRERENCAAIIASQNEYTPIVDINIIHNGNVITYVPEAVEIKGHIFNIHGGGLIAGTCEQNDPFCKWLADRGYVVHAIDYPLLPEVSFTDQVYAVCNAIWSTLPQTHDYPRYLIADSAGCLLAVIVNAIFHPDVYWHITNDFECDDFYEGNIEFDGVWLNCPMLETIGFNEFGLFMAKHCFGKNPRYKSYLKDIYDELCCYLPETTVVIASHNDKLKKQAETIFQMYSCSLGYGARTREEHNHDWNVLNPMLDNWTANLNDWAMRCLELKESYE